MEPRSNLKLASFDGGGVRGFSQLEIMRHIMHRLNWTNESDGDRLPCEHFDLIGGAGTGGMIAIFLTKLRMSVEEASWEFHKVAEHVYKPGHLSPSERTLNLRQCIESTLKAKGLPLDLPLTEETQPRGCAGFVVASTLANVKHNICLRTYPVQSQPSTTITAIEAILATCATQPEFDYVPSGSGFRKRDYIAASGTANPVQQTIMEAHSLFGGSSSVVFLLSIGTGHPGVISLHPTGEQTALHRVMRDMMHDCEQRAQEIEQRIGHVGIYSRFSVQQGMQNDHQEKIDDLSWIATQTDNYLNTHRVYEELEVFGRNFGTQMGPITLDQLKYSGGLATPNQVAASVETSLAILISNKDDIIIANLKPTDVECGPHVLECMEGTRQHILERIYAWEMDFEAPNILLLKSHPGAGKSAIAATVVERLRPSARYGSSFFFRREMASVMSPHSLWRTVAYDLARRHSTIRNHLVTALKANESLPATVNIDTLFRQLIQDPLTASGKIAVERLPVIVVDALDECGGFDGQYSDYRKGLLRTLKNWSRLPRKFKLVVTSRGESDIERLFSMIDHYPLEILTGRNIDSASSGDIEVFLRHGFQQIANRYPSLGSDWPGEEVTKTMNDRSAGLFIWPKTVLKFLERGEPQQILKLILQGGGAGGMSSLYTWILNAAFPNPTGDDIQKLRSVLGALIFHRIPLDLPSLARLLSIEDSVVEYICNGLQSVLDCEGAARIHHQSFVDFLINPKECPPDFLINRERENRTITLACLQTMKCHLRFNICDLKSSYLRNNDVPDLALRVAKFISPYLDYASRFWASHLTDTAFSKQLFESIQYFIRNQFLFWLEALSLAKRAHIGSGMLQLLVDWMRKFNQNDSLPIDMQKFIVNFASVILQSAPHIYLSALPFAPRRSAVSEQYLDHYPKTLAIRHGKPKNWPVLQGVFSGHNEAINSVAISPDGRRVASGSSDKTVRVWDSETGETVVGPLEGHTSEVNSVSFSPDGEHIISASGYTIRLWDAKTGRLLMDPLQGHGDNTSHDSLWPENQMLASSSSDTKTQGTHGDDAILRLLEEYMGTVISVSFSFDSQTIGCGPQDRIFKRWNLQRASRESDLRPYDRISAISMSPNGRRIVTGFAGGNLRIWDAKWSDRIIDVSEGHSKEVKHISFSLGSGYFASCSCDGSIIIWSAETGSTINSLRMPSDEIDSVSFSPDGSRLVASSQHILIVWIIQTGETVMELYEGYRDRHNPVLFSPGGKRIFMGHGDTLQVWDAETGDRLFSPLQGHSGVIHSTSFSPDGKHIVTGSEDRTIRVWSVKTGKMVVEPFQGHSGAVRSVTFSPDGRQVLSGSDDATIRVWDTETGATTLGPLYWQSDPIHSISFSPDGRRIIASGFGYLTRLWDVANGEVFIDLCQHFDSVSFSPDGRYIVAGSYDTVQLWNSETGKIVIEPLKGHSDGVTSVLFSPDGRRIFTGSRDKTIRVWDTETIDGQGEPLKVHDDVIPTTMFLPQAQSIGSGSRERIMQRGRIMQMLKGYTDWVGTASFSSDGSRMASGFGGLTIQVWDTTTGDALLGPLEGHTKSITSISFSPDGRRIITGSEDQTIRLWSVETGQIILGPLEGDSAVINSVSFSPDGRRFVSASDYRAIRLWNAETGLRLAGPLEGHKDSVACVSFSCDGGRLVSGSWDKTIRVWDVETRKTVIGPLSGHTEAVRSVSFSSDGRRIVSGSHDKTVRVWSAETGEMIIGPLKGHSDVVKSVLFSPIDGSIVSGSADGSIRVWDAAVGAVYKSIHSLYSDSPETKDGWILGPNSELLFWVPPEIRPRLCALRNTLVIGEHATILDLKTFAHGEAWSHCGDH